MRIDTTPVSVTTRAARADDWVAVSALLTEARLPLAGARDHLGDFIVAEGAGGAVLGCAALERYMAANAASVSGLLRSLAVAPDARGLGLGALLVGRLLDTARAEGLSDVILLTTTAADYFPRFGFRVIARDEAAPAVRVSAEFREVCPVSATAMSLAL